MKTALIAILLTISVSTNSAQGLVTFANTPATLVSAGPAGQQTPISGPPGAFFFGLLIAPPGTTNPSQFAFSGVYATNSAVPGRILPGAYAPFVPGWPVAVTMSFLVAGWSSSLGHDWNEQWVSGNFDAAGYFGLSSISSGLAGGPSGGVPIASFPLFGGTGIQTGWNLNPVPEPSVNALLALGTAAFMLQNCVRTERNGVRTTLF